jgi:hypothetical protein
MSLSITDVKSSVIRFFAVLLLGWLLGMGTGWKLWQTTQPNIHVMPKPAIHNSDGSVALEVQPAHNPKPVQQIPAGSHVESVVSVTVQPNATQTPQALPVQPSAHGSLPGPIERPPCPPVTVDLTVYRDADGSRRVVVSSPDGTILKGIHLENEVGPPAPKLLKNSAGLVAGSTAWGDKALGVYYDHDWKFLRFGGELTKNTYAIAGRQGWEVRLKTGIIF